MTESDHTIVRGEKEPTGPMKTLPNYMSQSPNVHPSTLLKEGESGVMVTVAKPFHITLSDGARTIAAFPAGTYPIPEGLSKHYYVAANGVVIAGQVQPAGAPKIAEAPPKPTLETADPKPAPAIAAIEGEDKTPNGRKGK